MALVDQTVDRVLACPVKVEPTFEGFGEFLSVARSATTHEGKLIERAVEIAVGQWEHLTIVALERPLPVLAAAKALLDRNDFAKLGGLRLDAEVHTIDKYPPDILLVDGRIRRALLLDIKRAVGSHKPGFLRGLRNRMAAASMVTRDYLERYHDVPPVDRVEFAIVDASGESIDHDNAIFGLADLDALLGIEGAAAAVEAARGLFGERIRQILHERCLAIARRHAGEAAARGSGTNGTGVPASTNWNTATPGDDAADCGDEPVISDEQLGRPASAGLALHRDRRVSVGIARIGGRA